MQYQDPILVVEDSQEDFETIAEAAVKAEITAPLIHARDAFEAAKVLGLEPGFQPQKLAMVILDYNLPGKSGLELLTELSKANPQSTTPVVFYTTSSSLNDCKQCYEAGANAYHVKSLGYSESVNTIQGIFHYWLNLTLLPTVSKAA